MSTPIVFLHAFPYGPAMWDAQAEAVGGRAVLAPHILGYRSLEGAAAHVLAEMDGRGWERAVLVGLSMGGYVLFRLWNLAPERVAGVVLADTRATPDTPEQRAARAKTAERIAAEGMGFFPEGALLSNLGESTRARRPELVERVRQTLLAADPAQTIASLEGLADRPDSVPLLGGISVPALILVGEEDTLTPPAESRLMAGRIPDSRMLVLPEAGHMSNLENPKAFNTALLGFLSEVG